MLGWDQPEKVLRAMRIGGSGLLAALLAGCGRPVPSVKEGRRLYEANGCVSCHGLSGRGDGPLGPRLASKPVDLSDPALFLQGSTEDAIARTLAEGVTVVRATPELHHNHHEAAMPKFDHLTEVERHSIALYVISLRRDDGGGRAQP